METSSSPSSSSSSDASLDESPTFSEFSLRETLLFSDSLKDLRNLRSQLYSAAEYFEHSYSNDEQKQTVVDSLKDYTVKAFVNTVDHLGSVSCKVDGFLGEKVDEVSGAELRVTSIEQRLRTCQGMIDQEGLAQQMLIITAPKYHKRYILPGNLRFLHEFHNKLILKPQSAFSLLLSLLSLSTTFTEGESMPGSWSLAAAYHEEPRPLELDCDHDNLSASSADHPTVIDSSTVLSKYRSPTGRSPSPTKKSRAPSPCPLSEKRSGSPIPISNPDLLVRSGSLSRWQPMENPSSNSDILFTMNPRKSVSVRQQENWDEHKDPEQNLSKTKRLFKSLLSRRKSRRDDMLYAYLDEY